MKIKKGLFTTQIEFKPDEFMALRFNNLPGVYCGILLWLKKEFKLDLFPKK